MVSQIALAMLVSGCHFGVPGLSASGGDAIDLAAPDGGTHDPPATADLGAPDDLGAIDLSPALDLGPSCAHVVASFDRDPEPQWILSGDAYWDQTQRRLELQSLNLDRAGAAFYGAALQTSAFEARFRFRLGDGSGGDGMAFVLAKASSAAALMPFGNGPPGQGYGLGYYGMNGFAVELDSFQNFGNGDPDGNHVGFMRAGDGTHLLVGTPTAPPLHSNATRSAHVRFTGTHLFVEIDGVTAIDADLPSGTTFVPDEYFFGFTGATGGANDHHSVLDLQLTVGPAGCW